MKFKTWKIVVLMAAVVVVVLASAIAIDRSRNTSAGSDPERHRRLLGLISDAEMLQTSIPSSEIFARLNENMAGISLASAGQREASRVTALADRSKVTKEREEYSRLVAEIRAFKGDAAEVDDFMLSHKIFVEVESLESRLAEAKDGNRVSEIGNLISQSEAKKEALGELRIKRFKRHLDWFDANRELK